MPVKKSYLTLVKGRLPTKGEHSIFSERKQILTSRVELIGGNNLH
jgi:hypothetical protein